MHGESHGYGFGVVYFMFHLIQFILCSLFNLFHSINLLNPHLLCIYVYIHSLYLLIIILVTFFVRYTLWSPLWTIPTYSILPIGFLNWCTYLSRSIFGAVAGDRKLFLTIIILIIYFYLWITLVDILWHLVILFRCLLYSWLFKLLWVVTWTE